MANAITITYGSTTLNLLDLTNYGVKEYVPLPGEGEGDGFVTETAEIYVYGSSMTALQAALQALQKALWLATRYEAEGQGDAVYLNVQPNGASASYRSQILEGSVVTGEETLGVDVANLEMLCQVNWTRRGYWEGAEAQIPLTNVNGTDNTSGLYVTSLDTRVGSSPTIICNYAEVDGVNDVAGNLPGFIKVEQKLVFEDDLPVFEKMFIGQSHLCTNFTNLDTQIGSEGSKSWTETTEKELSLEGSNYLAGISQRAANGSWFRMLLVLRTACALTDLYLRFRVKVQASSSTFSTIYNGPLTYYNGETIIDLGIMRIPPFVNSSTEHPNSLLFSIMATSATVGTKTIDFQYLELRPIDGWREISSSGINWVLGETNAYTKFMLNEYDKDAYILLYAGSGAVYGMHGMLTKIGKPLTVMPGKTQRFYFSWLAPDGIEYSLVKIYYRPRRLSL